MEFAADSEKLKVEEVIRLFKKKAENIHIQDFNSNIKQNKGELLNLKILTKHTRDIYSSKQKFVDIT